MNGRVSSFICNGHRNFFIQGIRNYAGHSKWQNIKATKTQNDTAKSLLFQSLSSKMRGTVAETGDPDPTTNSRLAALIDQARKSNMPSSTLNNILEKLKDTKLDGRLNSMPIRNNTGAILIVYFKNENIIQMKNLLAQISKKYNSKIADNTLLNTFECASYIIASKDCDIDQAMEDAIQTDADDVEQIKKDNETYFQFKSKYLNPDKTSTQLTNLGYAIESIDSKCMPLSEVQLSEGELALINKMKTKIKAEVPGVIKIEDNIAS